MRLVYLGTPDSAVPTLRALVDAGHEVVLAVTQPDRKRGRGGALVASPVKQAATELGIPVSHNMRDVLDVDADYGVVVVFGQLIKPDVLAHLTFLNLHPSMLPRWRGATPVESALLAGDTDTGICLMQLDAGMDTGPLYACHETQIGPTETATELLERLLATGTEMLLRGLSDGLPVPKPQQGEPTHARKLTGGDFHIDWKEPAEMTLRRVRLGRAWTTFRGKRLRILRAELAGGDYEPGVLYGDTAGAAENGVRLIEVQPEGKGPQSAQAWLNGARIEPDERLG